MWPERGEVIIKDFEVRKPEVKEILIKTRSTLISPGTEGAFLMALSNTSGKFSQYPGCSNAGEAISVRDQTSSIRIGDKVVSRDSR
ncbi:hypothetical protein J7M02_00565 [Candidatus Aerophobetes bacterium]|nr:hypothetical protein [Candidatus Aerophobetes bacterium]